MDLYEFDISKYKGIGQLLFDLLSKNPNVVGQIDAKSGEKYTFETMLNKSVRCALWLKKQCLQKGDIVVVSTNIQMDDFVPLLACLFIGVIFCSWDYEIIEKEIEYYVESASPKVIFSIERNLDKISSVLKKLDVNSKIVSFENYCEFESLAKILENQKEEEIEKFEVVEVSDLKEVAGICFSSGTTSSPKPVEIPHLLYLLNTCYIGMLMPENSISLSYSKMSWITAQLFIFGSILKNSTRIVHDNPDEEETCGVIDEFKVTWACIFTTLLKVMHHHKTLEKYDLSSVKSLMTTGNKINGDILRVLARNLKNAHVYSTYGATEAGAFLTYHPEKTEKFDSCGKAAPHVKIEIVDLESGNILENTNIGEICIRSPCFSTGYYKCPSLTAELFDDTGRLRTGDVGFFDEDGYLYVTDRIKNTIQYKSHDVNVGDLEKLLEAHPGVAAVAIIGVPHDLDNHHPMAFVQKNPNHEATEEELIKLSSTLGDKNLLRGGVQFLDELPYTSNNKIKIGVLKEMAKQMANK